RDRAVSGPALVPEELLAERDLLSREWVLVRNVCGVLLEAQRQRQLVLAGLTDGGEDEDPRQDQPGRPSAHGRVLVVLSVTALVLHRLVSELQSDVLALARNAALVHDE